MRIAAPADSAIAGRIAGVHTEGMSAESILVIEDDQQVADVVVYSLQKQGFGVEHAADGQAGLAAFRRRRADLVVLDLNLPRLGGREVFTTLRRHDAVLPVIMLTCQSEEIDRIVGLEMGADDYVTKPFSARELAVRVKAVLRRCRAGSRQSAVLSEGPVEIDPESLVFTYFGQRLELTRQEFAIMKALAGHPARTFTRDDLIRRMYDGEHAVTDRTVDAAVKRLRRKLEAVRPDYTPIKTVYGLGYKFNAMRPA